MGFQDILLDILALKRGVRFVFVGCMSRFWWKNNLSLFDHYDFAKKKIEEWDREGHIEKTETRPDFILVWPHVKCIGVSKSFVYALTVHISPIIYWQRSQNFQIWDILKVWFKKGISVWCKTLGIVISIVNYTSQIMEKSALPFLKKTVPNAWNMISTLSK